MKKGFCVVLLLLVFGLGVFSPAYALEPLKFYRAVAGDQTFAVKQGYVNNYVLTANTNTAVTVPTGASYAVFSATVDIWVNIGGTAAVPSTNVTDGTGSDLNPTIRRVESGGTIGVISEYAAKVSIAFYE